MIRQDFMLDETETTSKHHVRRWNAFKIGVFVFLGIYAVATLFPFYALFIRTFVGTDTATQLHLWIPPVKEVSLDAEVGNLSVYFNLDLQKVKADLGIPPTEYLSSRMSLRDIAEKYDIPEEEIREYLRPFYTFNGWIVLFSGERLKNALWRTFVITALSLIGVNLLSLLTGYGLAGLNRIDQRFIYNLYVINPLIPPMLVLLPQFVIIQFLLGFLPESLVSSGKMFAIVLLQIKGGALPIMIYTAFISSIPHEIQDAAEIDGASPFQYIRYVIMPLLKVPIATVTVIMLPWFWNNFLQPYVYLDAKNTMLLPLIQQYTGQYTTNYQVSFTGIFVSIIPLVIVYFLFRRWFIEGAMAGAIKG